VLRHSDWPILLREKHPVLFLKYHISLVLHHHRFTNGCPMVLAAGCGKDLLLLAKQ
jgi:hypothetical protein